jgi:glycosyltransferase involved in cell wall biosynthesis
MHRMTEANHPLVTFALFAYNQESYVRDAIEGALAQTYEPLEIILSDDCSTDRTFELMQEMASAYRGRHRVIARRTTMNVGVLLHLADVAGMAQGRLLVHADGDDISKPERTEVLVQKWQSTGAWGICSRYDRMDEAGTILERAVEPSVIRGHRLVDYFYPDEGEVPIVQGCASAWDTRSFEYLDLSTGDYILSQDGVMSVLLNLLGRKIIHVDESLVCYRENSNSLTNYRNYAKRTYSDIVRDEARIERFAASQRNRCRLFLRMDALLGDIKARRLNVDEVERDLRRQDARVRWSKTGFSGRLRYVIHNPGSSELKWAIPRLFGLQPFFAFKWLLRRAFRGRRDG